MKRLIITAFLILFAALCFAQNQSAVIKEMTGTVELKIRGTGQWVPAKTGDVIEKNTIVSTGFRSIAILKIGNSTLTVSSLTCLTLEELINLNQTETVNLNLSTGRVRVEVTPPAGSRTNLNVQTPSTTASVRGTTFDMDTVSIHVTSGEVSFSSSEGKNVRPVIVGAGQESYFVSDTGTMVTPMQVEDAKRNPVLSGQYAVVAERAAEAARARLEFGSLEVNTGGILINGE